MTSPPHLLHYSFSSPPPSTLFFKSSLYPLCLLFLIYVSFSIPEQIEGEKKRERQVKKRIIEGKEEIKRGVGGEEEKVKDQGKGREQEREEEENEKDKEKMGRRIRGGGEETI